MCPNHCSHRGNISTCLIPPHSSVTAQQLPVWIEGFSASLAHQSRHCAVKYQKLGLAERVSHLHKEHKVLPCHPKPQPCTAVRTDNSYPRIRNTEGDRSTERGERGGFWLRQYVKATLRQYVMYFPFCYALLSGVHSRTGNWEKCPRHWVSQGLISLQLDDNFSVKQH